VVQTMDFYLGGNGVIPAEIHIRFQKKSYRTDEHVLSLEQRKHTTTVSKFFRANSNAR